MNKRDNCYLNSAYNSNVDDVDDFIDTQSELSFSSDGIIFEPKNEISVDSIVDSYNKCYGEDDQLRTLDDEEDYRYFPKSKYNVIYNDSFLLNNSEIIRQDKITNKVTSTPKKCTLSECKNPNQRREIIRSRSFSAASRKEYGDRISENSRLMALAHHSKSSSNINQKIFWEQNSQSENQLLLPKLTFTKSRNRQYPRSRSFHSDFTPSKVNLQRVNSVIPFQKLHRSSDRLISHQNSFIHRSNDLNSSFSATKPLITPRNTAIISPIYNQKMIPSTFNIDNSSPPRSAFIIAADRSISSTKSWLQMRKQKIPLCTLHTSAIAILLSSALSCLLCIHIIAVRGKSYEITLSLITSFVTLCVGFPCFQFQDWQWLPNHNYVSGYVLLSLFSILLSMTLWTLDKYPNLSPEVIDLMKGALWALCSLTLTISLLGICTSYCCKYPPPDNRVSHGVEGFSV